MNSGTRREVQGILARAIGPNDQSITEEEGYADETCIVKTVNFHDVQQRHLLPLLLTHWLRP